METSTSKRAFLTILLISVPVLCILIGWFQVPQPVSAEKERKTFAREKLKSERAVGRAREKKQSNERKRIVGAAGLDIRPRPI